MGINHDELSEFACRGIEYALAIYAATRSPREHYYTNILGTLELLGLDSSRAEEIYHEVTGRLIRLIESVSQEDVEKIIRECLDEYKVFDEAVKRIHGLPESSRRILQYGVLRIRKSIEKWHVEYFNSDDVADFVSVMLGEDISRDEIEQLFVRTLLAVRNHSSGRRYYYTVMKLIPNTKKLVYEISSTVEKELPSYDEIYSKLKYTAEAFQIAALCNPDSIVFNALYGFKLEDVVTYLEIPKIVHKGKKNNLSEITKDIYKAVQTLAQEHADNTMVNRLADAFKNLGYEIDLKHKGFLEYAYCCRYTATRPGTVLYIYVCPFAVKLPGVGKDEKAVIVFEGIGANLLEYINILGRHDWYKHLANALWICIHKNNVYILNTTIKDPWQKEIVESLRKTYPNVHIIPPPTPVERKPIPIPVPTTPLPITPTPVPVETIRSHEDMKTVVAQVLEDMGFSIYVNAVKATRRNAEIEVDIWAEKQVGMSRFKIHVSCGNWDRDIDRLAVAEESSKIMDLVELPHLRILVVKSISKTAKGLADLDGFFVIELGEKTVKANAQDVYETIYRELSEIFTNIAPLKLVGIARRVNKTAEELHSIAQELSRLSQNYR
ncbi:hypothetical protein J4526_07435 [Desulfurococcaceae archaeon MEX13E-LK6-19]|nr:hypothetical protein J4526_07435 [Desulfurococcaceae archaeon MEX13E-LK6-19]